MVVSMREISASTEHVKAGKRINRLKTSDLLDQIQRFCNISHSYLSKSTILFSFSSTADLDYFSPHFLYQSTQFNYTERFKAVYIQRCFSACLMSVCPLGDNNKCKSNKITF